MRVSRFSTKASLAALKIVFELHTEPKFAWNFEVIDVLKHVEALLKGQFGMQFGSQIYTKEIHLAVHLYNLCIAQAFFPLLRIQDKSFITPLPARG
jgi:hypothetical protein